MDIKLLFQILTPLSMGGSIIGLFGDFGDGWVAVSHQNGEALEFGGVHLYERNPDIFGLEDGKQRWNQAEVGKTYYDYHFQGITNLEDFSTDPGKDNRNLLINGFGLQIQSKKGGVVSGRKGEATTAKDLRDGSLGLASAKDGVREISLEVKRVGIVSSEEGQVDQVVPLDDMCVVNVGRKDSVYMIFAGIKMIKHSKDWIPQDAERFLKLDGCKFFGSIKHGNRSWLRRIRIGKGGKGSALMIAEGDDNKVDGIIGWPGTTKGVFREILKPDEYGGVALVGVVVNMTKFLPAAECVKGPKKVGSFCDAEWKNESKYELSWVSEWGNWMGNRKFEGLINPNKNGLENTASTGKGWLQVRRMQKEGRIENWRETNFQKWVTNQARQAGWNLPIGVRLDQASPLEVNKHDKSKRWFKYRLKHQIAADGSLAGSKYEWKKTAVMRHKKIKEF